MNKSTEIIKEELSYINEQALFADGFDEALVGIDQSDYVAVYDIDKCIDILKEDMSYMTLDQIIEYFEYNTLGAYVGEYTPRFIRVYHETDDSSHFAT
jgi:hypothetical protein